MHNSTESVSEGAYWSYRSGDCLSLVVKLGACVAEGTSSVTSTCGRAIAEASDSMFLAWLVRAGLEFGLK